MNLTPTQILQVVLAVIVSIIPQMSTAFPAQSGIWNIVGTLCGGVLGALSGVHAAALSGAKTDVANAKAETVVAQAATATANHANAMLMAKLPESAAK